MKRGEAGEQGKAEELARERRLTLMSTAVDPFVSSFEHEGHMEGMGVDAFGEAAMKLEGVGRGVKWTVMSFLRLQYGGNEERSAAELRGITGEGGGDERESGNEANLRGCGCLSAWHIVSSFISFIGAGPSAAGVKLGLAKKQRDEEADQKGGLKETRLH